MKKESRPLAEDIMREDIKKQKYQNYKRGGKTFAQFQLYHCRYCKNKDTDLCEIRRNINNELNCEYEENVYERANIK